MRESPNSGGFKKSLYLFLSAILGVLLFLILHRIVIFFYLVLSGAKFIADVSENSYLLFLAADYFTLILAMMFGAWYGIWLGLYWYEKVYEEGSHRGFADYVAHKYWPGRKHSGYQLNSKIKAVQKKLETDLWELEGLTKSVKVVSSDSPKPIKRQMVRKRAPKRLKDRK